MELIFSPHDLLILVVCVKAGLKSFIHHLHRALNNNKITLENFETPVKRILNFQDLITFSGDINKFEVLTPSYFNWFFHLRNSRT